MILAAAELVTAAERARRDHLDGRLALTEVVRVENLAARALRRIKLDKPAETLGGTLVATTEILGDLVKINWGKAAGAVVSIVDRRLELMKSELANPAKEISYIVKAQEQFGE
jgi:hypothetical protein